MISSNVIFCICELRIYQTKDTNTHFTDNDITWNLSDYLIQMEFDLSEFGVFETRRGIISMFIGSKH